jgi:hypothetical protein
VADRQFLRTPVVFIIFNRPEIACRVFEEIRRARPLQLLVIADGPRAQCPDDITTCREVRRLVTKIDWNCEVKTNFSEENLGCGKRISTGLDWVFANVEEAVILEDDCLPHPSFFQFCEELLGKYRTDERIMHISGDNFQFGQTRGSASYYFSRHTHIWGWATWRRAWKHFDADIRCWPEVRERRALQSIWADQDTLDYWTNIFQLVYQGKIGTWDYQWTLACWLQNALSILPNVNLVSNIGFSSGATHTKSRSPFAELTTQAMAFPLAHPRFVLADQQADRFTQQTHFFGVGPLARARRRLGKLLREAIPTKRDATVA